MIHKSKLVLLASVLSFSVPSLAYSLDLGLGGGLDIEESLDLDDTLDDVIEDVGGAVDELDVADVVEVDVTDAVQEIVDHGGNAVDDLLGGDIGGGLDEVEAIVADVEVNTDNGLGIGLGGDPTNDIALNVPDIPELPIEIPQLPEIPGLPGGGGGQGPGGGGPGGPGGNGGNGGTTVVTRTIVRGGGGGGGGGAGGGMSAYQQLLARFNAMTTAQRGQLIAQCLAVLANPRQYGSDQVQLCQMVAQIPGIMGYLNVAAR